MAESLEFLDGEPGVCRVAVLKNVMIVVWSAGATATAAAKLDQATERLAATYPSGLSAVHVIPNLVSVPTADGRNGLMRIMSRHAKSLACVAVVVGGTGFWASTMRSFITGMRFMTPRSFDLRLHGGVDEVIEWLPNKHSKLTGVPIDATALARVLESATTWPSESADLFERSSETGR